MSNDTLFTSKSRSNESKDSKKTNFLLFPIAIVLIIIPLLVYEYGFTPTIAEESWFPPVAEVSDFFVFYKGIVLTVIGFLMLTILLYKQLVDKKKPFSTFPTWQFPLAIYAIFVLASTFASSYSKVCWNGSFEQFETTLVLIAYCILVFYSYYVIQSQDDLHSILRYLFIGIAIITFIGVLQLLGLDPFNSTWGKYLIASDKSKESIDAMQFNFEKNRVYMTLLNPNYVGVYASMLFPITMGMTILFNEKGKKVISAILSILLVVVVFGSQSKTGLIALTGTGILNIIVLRKKVFSNRKVIVTLCAGIVVVIVGFFGVNAIQDNAYLNAIKQAFTQKDHVNTLESIETQKDNILIKYSGKTLHLRCELDTEGKVDVGITDENGSTYKMNYDESTLTFSIADDELKAISVTPIYLNEDGVFGCEVVIDNHTWYFKSRTETEGYSYMNKYSRLDQIKSADASLFKNHQSIFSGRGYIWSRTIPLLKDNLIVGVGPSAFVYAFPQTDYVGKYNNGFDSQVVTKPHNLYMQMAVETGLVSCIAFIVLCLMYIIECIRIQRKSALDSLTEQMGILICVAVIGYLVSGIINDSNPGVAPIFWVLLGIGFACNQIIKNEIARKKRLESME